MSSVVHMREEKGDVTTDRRGEDHRREAEGKGLRKRRCYAGLEPEQARSWACKEGSSRLRKRQEDGFFPRASRQHI